jgi:hypothetical protein
MTATYNDIRAAIEVRIATQMAIAPVYPVSYQNVPFTPPNNTPAEWHLSGECIYTHRRWCCC